MNSIPFFSKIEILLYSTLTSVMSGISHLKVRAQHLLAFPIQPRLSGDHSNASLNGQAIGKTVSIRWEAIQQAMLALLLWVILGFAAGFLIGMFRSR